MKKMVVKIINFWKSLKLHIRITVISVSVLSLGLISSALIAWTFGIATFRRNVGQKAIFRLREFDDGFGREFSLTQIPNESRPRLNNNDNFSFLQQNRPQLFDRTGDDIFNSLVPFFVITAIVIVILGTVVVYFSTRGTLEKIEQEQLKLKQFVADASHDLRTPLTVISGYAQIIGMKNDKDSKDASQKILTNANRMNELVEDMLILAKNDLNEKPSISHLDLDSFYKELAVEFAKTNETQFAFSLKGNPFINIDESKLRRVSENILNNSIKHNSKDVKISVEVGGNNSGAKLTFKDWGVGVEETKLNDIFERFVKLDSSRAEKGNGLGLAIVKETVVNLGGTIKAKQTEKTGQGLTIEIWLPNLKEEK